MYYVTLCYKQRLLEGRDSKLKRVLFMIVKCQGTPCALQYDRKKQTWSSVMQDG